MNSITHAYSVIAFLLILGCTLMGLPMSVFSQSSESTTVETSIIDETDALILEDEVVGTTAISAEGSLATPSVAGASLKYERLPTDQVFSDFVVGPGRFVLEIAPGESKVVQLTVSNRMGSKKRFSFETEDMSGSTDGSQSVTLLGSQEGPYTLRDFIKTPVEFFDLEHSQRVLIPVTVSMPADAEPGGRYGSLLISIISDDQELDDVDGALPGTKVISRIGTLFFVTTPGEIERKGKLQKFSTIGDRMFFSEGPIDFGVVMENTGSVHITPSGDVRIYNMTGAEVGSVTLPSWFVMPSSLRVREISWNREFLVGKYTAVATIDRGYDNIIDEQSYSFWVIPLKPIGLIFLGLFLFFLLIRFVFSKFEFRVKTKGN